MTRWLSAAFDTGVRRRPAGLAGVVVRCYAALVAAWTIWAAAFSRSDALSLTIIFLTLMLVLGFLVIGPGPNARADRVPGPDWFLALVAALAGAWFVWHADDISQRITLLDPLSLADQVAAIVVIALALEATRRAVGLGLTVIVLVFMAYNLFGHWLDGPLQHGVIGREHFLDIMVFTTDGLFGVPLRVAATYAFLFVLFGTALARCGGADFFFDLASSISGRRVGGPAKIAVVSSGLYGTISGSPTSDVVTTGAVTIPMMKRLGYPARFAAAVEVAASTGGSLLPPVMGAAAFIMAEYTGIAYIDIAIAAVVPALLYYACVYLAVELRARRLGLAALDAANVPRLTRVLRGGGIFLIPLLAITWALLDGYTPTYAALYGLVAVVVVSWFRPGQRIGPRAAFDTLAETSLRMVAVTGACAAAGLVIGGITMTGLASKLGNLIFLLSGNDAFWSLVVAAAMTILLGMGMPTPSAYILAAVLIGPALAGLNFDLMAVHLFLLYFAVMSALTPPVAVAAYAASALADTGPIGIALSAVRLALPAFVVPFAFIYETGLLLEGGALSILASIALAGAGLAALVMAGEGWGRARLRPVERGLLGALGLTMLVLAKPFAFAALAVFVLWWFVGGRLRSVAAP